MNKKEIANSLLYVMLFVAVFFLLQFSFQLISVAIFAFLNDVGFQMVEEGLREGKYSAVIVIGSIFSSLTAIVLFAKLGWAPVSRSYLKTKPCGVLFWAMILAIGAILPLEFAYEKVQIVMSKSTQQLFEGIMREPWGYVAIGILAPIAEEMIFRGGILRKLLSAFDAKCAWCAIVLSALIFALVHLNLAQGVHAFIMGLLLGWMYMRTRSVVPGIAFHWVNNTVAYLMFHLMPELSDGQLLDLFHGNERLMHGGLFFSLCILLPAIFQLTRRMKRADA